MEKAADMVVLVVGGKQPLGLCAGKPERGERDRVAELAGLLTVELNEISQRHHRRTTSSFSGHGASCRMKSSVSPRNHERKQGLSACEIAASAADWVRFLS